MPAVPEPVHGLASAISEDPGHAPGFSFAALEWSTRVSTQVSHDLRTIDPLSACRNYGLVVVMEITSLRSIGSGAIRSHAAGL